MSDAPRPEVPSEEKYWAFISYSHRDRAWGEWLHRKLETFRLPKRLIGSATRRGAVPERLFPIFRDREELPVSADLGRNIDEALRLSRFLVVICSPAAAKSRWVNEEILTFKRLGRSERVLALIVDGEPNASDGKAGFTVDQECFPEAMRFAMGADGKLTPLRTEPIAADVRPGQDGRDNAFLKLVAGITSLNFDDLRQREHERKIRRLRMVVAAAFLLLAVFAVLGTALFFQRNYARMQKNRAETALQQVRHTLSRSDYLQAVEALSKGLNPEAMVFLSRAVRTDPSHSAATELITSLLAERTWLLPAGEPLRIGEQVGVATFDSKGEKVFISEDMEDWHILDAATGRRLVQGKVAPARIGRASFTPDGARIAIISGPTEANVVRVFDVQNATATSPVIPLKGVALSAAFSPDGKRLLVTGGNFVSEFDSESGAETAPPIDHKNPVMYAVYTPDRSTIISAALFETFFWNASTRQLDGAPLKHDAIPQSFAISPAGDKLAIALGDSTGRLFTLPDREPLGEPFVHRSDINELRFSNNGVALLSCSNDKTAALWDASTGARMVEPMRHQQPVIAAALRPEENAILTVSGGQSKPAWLHKWILNRPQPTRINFAHEGQVLSFAITSDGTLIATGCGDGKIYVWNTQTHSLAFPPMPHEFEIIACTFSPDGKTIAAAAGPIVTVWDASSGKAKFAPLAHGGIVTTVHFSPDGQRLLSGSSDGSARLWNASDGTAFGKPMPHPDGVTAAEFSPDGKWMITGGGDGTARVWDATSSGKPRTETMLHGSPVTVAHFSPDGGRIVTGAKDGTARIWDAVSGSVITPPLVHDREVTEALFSKDSRLLATAVGEVGGQGATRVWDAERGVPLTDPMLHPDGVETAALHPDGERLITGAFDGMLRVWDVHTGKPRSVSIRFGEPVVKVEFVPGTPRLAVASGSVLSLVDLIDPRPAAPEWLAGLAERVGGLRFTPQSLLEPTPERSVERLRAELSAHEPRDGYERFGRWFLGGAPKSQAR